MKQKSNRKSDDMSAMWGRKTAQRSATAKRGDWFRESKYAMFIHWGLFSQAANQWKGETYHGIAEWLMYRARITVAEYEGLAKLLNPVDFNAADWVRLAKAAGMKYIVVTAKHHEGFAMFRSRASSFNIYDASPFRRDPLLELAEACRQEGLKLGFYYSQYLDWHEPDAAGNDWEFKQKGDFNKYLHHKAIPQIRELLTNYGPVALIWFDCPGEISIDTVHQLRDMVRKLQPDCLINSRIGHGLGDYVSAGDQEVPLVPPEGLWEAVDTHNDTWAYSAPDHNWKSPAELISRLVRVVSLGGSYMLNVGPTGKGIIPPESEIILRETGKWIHRNAESIYGAGPSPLSRQAWGVATSRQGVLYLHILNWPSGGELWIPGLSASIKSAYWLVSGKSVRCVRKKGCLCLQLPEIPPDQPAAVIAVEVRGKISKTKRQIMVHPGLLNELDAPFARLTGCKHGKQSWMEKFGDWHHADFVESWQKGSMARWSFTLPKPGLFYLYADYDCRDGANDHQWEVSVGPNRWLFPVMATGGGAFGRTRIRHERLGVIHLPRAGDYTLSIKSMAGKEQPDFRLQRVTLEPVE
ncbi:MAG: alpha-L-fucosidase [bacterium]